MINDLLTAHNSLKYVTLYKDNWWIYLIVEQMQEQLNETLDKLYKCSEELYLVKKENKMLKARLPEIEKVVSEDDERIQFQCNS